MMASTSDCRNFLVDQAKKGNVSADWACDEDSAADEIANNDLDIGATNSWTKADWDREIKLTLPVVKDRVFKALTTASNWKRRAKYSGSGNVKSIREFMCDTPDNLFDGQVGYRVLEMTDGTLRLGEYIGD